MLRQLPWGPALAALTPIMAGALALSACAAEYADEAESAVDEAATQMVDTEAEAEAIMALETEWSSKFGAGDLDYVVNIHAADAIQLPPNAELVVGTEALRTAWSGMMEGLTASWESTAAVVSASGDMAWDYGTATVTTPDGVTTPMKYLVVWVREDGEWKVAADMFSANVPQQ